MYSENHPHYISRERLGEKEKLTEFGQDLVKKEQHLNGRVLCLRQIKESHDLLKAQHPERVITHILDREFDDAAVFSAISDLSDEFVIRATLSRVSTKGEEN